jgi:hypothetical protein
MIEIGEGGPMAFRRHYESFTAARDNLPTLLNAAREGVVTTLVRDHERFVVLPAAALRAELATLLPSRTVVAPEGGGWAAFIPDVPVHGDGDSFDAAIDDLVAALREYAGDWNDRLHGTPNHTPLRPVVQLVELSDDHELRAWILGGDSDDAEIPAAPQPADVERQLP